MRYRAKDSPIKKKKEICFVVDIDRIGVSSGFCPFVIIVTGMPLDYYKLSPIALAVINNSN